MAERFPRESLTAIQGPVDDREVDDKRGDGYSPGTPLSIDLQVDYVSEMASCLVAGHAAAYRPASVIVSEITPGILGYLCPSYIRRTGA